MLDDGADLPVVLQQGALQSFDSFPYVLIGWFDGIYLQHECSLLPVPPSIRNPRPTSAAMAPHGPQAGAFLGAQ